MRIRNSCDKITCLSLYFVCKKEHYMRLGVADKVRCLSSSMEELLQEIPWLLERSSELIEFVENEIVNQDMRYNFCFFLAVEKFAFILENFRENMPGVQCLMAELAGFVQREEFNAALVELELLHPSHVRNSVADTGSSCPSSNPRPCRLSNNPAGVKNKPKTAFGDYGAPQLDLISLVFRPPPRLQSKAAARMQELFESGLNADMEFHVAFNQVAASPLGSDEFEKEGGGEISMDLETADEELGAVAMAISPNKPVRIRAHRVIVASRCDWFRRALTSGMQEDITRRIVVHDVSPPVFKSFLEYLYTGTLTQNDPAYLAEATNEQWGCDQWAEMLLLSDRYEVGELITACELILKRFVNNECALYLLSIADQCNAYSLKAHCLNHIGNHPSARDSEDYCQLRKELRAEVDQTIRCAGRCSVSSHRARSRRYNDDSGIACLETMTQKLSIGESRGRHHRTGRRSRPRRHLDDELDFLERMPLVSNDDEDEELEDGPLEDLLPSVAREEAPIAAAGAASVDPRMERSLAELRDILGEEASVETLQEVLLAADFDLNRALNYFFTADHRYR